MKTELNYKGYSIRIEQDQNTDCPDDWSNEDNFIVYDHRDFTIKRKGFDPEDIFEEMKNGIEMYESNYYGHHKYFYFPVFAYIHSGVSLSLERYDFLCPGEHLRYDVSFKGFALIQKNEHVKDSEEAYKIAQSLLNEWNDYLSGNVYGFITEDSNGNGIDSCWGFYGDPETSGLIDEAKSSIDYEIGNRMKKRIDKVKTFIRNNVPLEKRLQLI